MTYTQPTNSTRLKNHGLRLEYREKAFVTGVDDVDSFNESEINMITSAGCLTITGSDLHITRLNLDEGQVVVEGNIDCAQYSEAIQEKGRLFSNIFK